jgi:hypothetical protein
MVVSGRVEERALRRGVPAHRVVAAHRLDQPRVGPVHPLVVERDEAAEIAGTARHQVLLGDRCVPVPAGPLVQQAQARAGRERHLARPFGDAEVGGHLRGVAAVLA